MEIANSIYLFKGIISANSYLYSTLNGAIIIDTGLPGSGKRIFSFISKLKLSAGSVKTIILTHSDIDHSGGVAELRRLTGGKVAIHEMDASALSGQAGLKKVKGVRGYFTGYLQKLMRFEELEPDILLKDGDIIDNLRVIHTPGHTEGSICLIDSDRALFAGDALKTDRKGRAQFSSDSTTLDEAGALKSLEKLAGYRFDALLPGHGPVVLHGGSLKVKELIHSEKPRYPHGQVQAQR